MSAAALKAPVEDAAVGQSATLYVANCTKQNAIVFYRTRFNEDGTPKDENRRFEAPKQMAIRSGRQEIIGQRNMPMVMAMEIITQLTSSLGLVDAEDVKRTHGKIQFVFQLNKPVPAEIIRFADAQNKGELLLEGSLRRKRAAVAVNDLVVQAAAEEAARVGREELQPPNTRVSFEQLEQTEMGEKTIAEGYKVDPNAPAEPPTTAASGRSDRGGRPNRGRR
jgi:hypothetical protein